MVRVFGRRASTTVGTEHCVREKVKAVLRLLQKNGPLTVKQLNHCDELCVARYLKAKGNNVKKAAKQLRASLVWRAALDLDHLTADDFSPELAIGDAFVAGLDEDNRPVVILRLKPEQLTNQSSKRFLRYVVYTLEVAIAAMPSDIEQCVLILDAGFLKNGSPGLAMVSQLLKMLGDHYPERVARVFFVDAPSIFYYLWKGIGAFMDHGMKQKLQFVFSRNYNTSTLAASHLMQAARLYSVHNFGVEQSDTEAEDSFRTASALSLPLADKDSNVEYGHSSGALLVADKGQGRSFSFASVANVSSWTHEAETMEFQSFRLDPEPVCLKESTASILRDRSRRGRSLGDFSGFEVPKRHEPQVDYVQRERIIDLFRTYLNFYRSPYNEKAYRALMKPPLGGLVSIISSDLKRQRSFSFDGSRVEVMLHHLNLD